VGLLGLKNDVYILHLSNLYKKAVNGNMFHINKSEEEIKPYLIVDKVYPWLPWLMIPHKQSNNIR
jgi:phospholipid N-methyltransferase